MIICAWYFVEIGLSIRSSNTVCNLQVAPKAFTNFYLSALLAASCYICTLYKDARSSVSSTNLVVYIVAIERQRGAHPGTTPK